MKKRIFKTTLILLGLLLIFSVPTFAKVGDVIGSAYHSDIVAYINHYAIPSYAVNGQTCIVVEDLKKFGFVVLWNEYTRSISISRNSNPYVGEINFSKNGKSGDFFSDILETDIEVYTGRRRITSFGLNGYTLIPMEELTDFGEVMWVPQERALKMWVKGLNVRPTKQYVAEYSEPVFYANSQNNSSAYNKLKNYLIRYGDLSVSGSYTTLEYWDDLEIFLIYNPDLEYVGFIYTYLPSLTTEETLTFYVYENERTPLAIFRFLYSHEYEDELVIAYDSPVGTIINSNIPTEKLENLAIECIKSVYPGMDLYFRDIGLDLKVSDFGVAY